MSFFRSLEGGSAAVDVKLFKFVGFRILAGGRVVQLILESLNKISCAFGIWMRLGVFQFESVW